MYAISKHHLIQITYQNYSFIRISIHARVSVQAMQQVNLIGIHCLLILLQIATYSHLYWAGLKKFVLQVGWVFHLGQCENMPFLSQFINTQCGQSG